MHSSNSHTTQLLSNGRIFEVRSCGRLDRAMDSAPSDPLDEPVTTGELKAALSQVQEAISAQTQPARSETEILQSMLDRVNENLAKYSSSKPKAKAADKQKSRDYYGNDPLKTNQEFADKAHERATRRGNDDGFRLAAPVGMMPRGNSAEEWGASCAAFGKTMRDHGNCYQPTRDDAAAEAVLVKLPVSGVEAVVKAHATTDNASYDTSIRDFGKKLRSAFTR